ncbi:MAG: ribonuclease HII [Minisyncoccia bacterium]
MKYIIGIDEVGRGSLAGPVFVCAVLIPKNFKIKNKKLGKLFDSKKLNLKKRFLWYKYLTNLKIKFAISKISPQKIDKINISNASNLGAFLALNKIFKKNKINLKNTKIFLDGGLFIKSKDYQKLHFLNAKTIIRGDAKYTAIKIASIMAKIQRDKYMQQLSKKYPAYLFEKHKGYGTKLHLSLIKKYGPSLVHRLTFI